MPFQKLNFSRECLQGDMTTGVFVSLACCCCLQAGPTPFTVKGDAYMPYSSDESDAGQVSRYPALSRKCWGFRVSPASFQTRKTSLSNINTAETFD